MTKNPSSSDRVRCAGLGVAVLAVGAVLLAMPADAATTSSITLSAPPVVGNAGATGAGSGLINVVNGNAASTTSHIDLDITAPAAIKAANITVSGLPTGDTATVANTGADVTVTIALGTLAAGPSSIPFTLAVDTGTTPVTGTLSTVASLFSTATASTPDATSTASTTQVVTGPAAPKVNIPGAATVTQTYSAAVLSLGSPKATVRVYDNKPNSGATGTTATLVSPTTGTNGDVLYVLNDKLVLDATTGLVTGRAVDLTKTDAHPDSYTIIANNGVGGADTAAPGTTTTPPVTLHDVSQTISIPVLFSDVSTSGQFSKAIYALAADGTLSGYGDGTFRPTGTVTRQAFVHFAAGVLNKGGFTTPTGACTTATPSSFTDVSSTSPFCQDIASLSALGVVNGYSDGTFHPSATVSRQAEAAFLYRVDEKFRGVDPKTGGDALCTSPSPFNDVSSTNPFCGDIEWASKHGIANGYADHGYHPTAGSSRQASAQFIYQLEALEQLV